MKAIIIALAILLAGCQSFGLAPPRNFDDRLAYTSGTITAKLQMCDQLYQRSRLTQDQGLKCLSLADQAAAAIAMARGSADPQTGQHWLTLATNLLTQLEAMLAESKQ